MIRTFLFWNLNKKPLEHLITQLAEQYKIDVFIFAESTIQPSTLLSALNSQETIYFYNRSGRPLNYFWNMFDQVMLRPSLLDAFKDDHLRVLESVGDFSLLSSRGTPDPTKASDHLPLLFAFDL